VLSTGAVTTIAGTAGVTGGMDGTGPAAQFNLPYDVVADNAGNLYVTDTYNSTIRMLVLSTGAVTTIAGTASKQGTSDGMGAAAQFDIPEGVTTDGAGNLYIADAGSGAIRMLALSTAAVTTIAGAQNYSGSLDGTGTAAQFYAPSGVATDGMGNLFVADTGNSTIRNVSSIENPPKNFPDPVAKACGKTPSSKDVLS
jgi:sugar lactone lactonase YvrE